MSFRLLPKSVTLIEWHWTA